MTEDIKNEEAILCSIFSFLILSVVFKTGKFNMTVSYQINILKSLCTNYLLSTLICLFIIIFNDFSSIMGKGPNN